MWKSVLLLHVAAGSIALAAMWIPLVARKGATLHRRAGWVFVAGMAVVSMTAVLLGGWRLVFDPRPEARAFGGFLLYVAILTMASVSSGIRVLRLRQRTASHRHWWDLGLPALLTLAGVGMAAFGLTQRQPLFAAFSVIGLATGISNLRYWLRPPASRMHWWFAHMNGMLGGCIAAVTAFFVTNVDNLGVAPLVAWLSPSIVGAVATTIWTMYYKQRFAVRPTRLRESVPRAQELPS